MNEYKNHYSLGWKADNHQIEKRLKPWNKMQAINIMNKQQLIGLVLTSECEVLEVYG